MKGKHFTSTRDNKCYWIIRRLSNTTLLAPNQKSNLKIPVTIVDDNLRYLGIYTQIFSKPFSPSKRTNNAMQFRGKNCEKNIKYIWYYTPREVFYWSYIHRVCQYYWKLMIALSLSTAHSFPGNCQSNHEFQIVGDFFQCNCSIVCILSKWSQPYNMRLCYLFKYLVGLNSATSLLSNIASIRTMIGVFRIKKVPFINIWFV